MASETGTHAPYPAAGTPPDISHPPASDLASVPAGQPAPLAERPGPNPDAPVRIEVEMPRDLYDRLTDWEDAPRSRYDMATGRAEYIAEPGVGHEGRVADVSELFVLVKHELHDAGHPRDFFVAGASRLLSDDGASEPDMCLFIDPRNVRAARKVDGYLDTRKGHPVPDLAVEIDRSIDSSHKLAPYFRMGVREAWTWSRRDGARLWVVAPEIPQGFRAADESQVLPGLARDELHRMLASYRPIDATRRVRHLARRIARALIDRRGGT